MNCTIATNLSLKLLHVDLKQGCSYSWNSIMKAFDVLNFAFKYRVGKEDISIFYSHWLDEGTICHELDYVHIFDTQLRIRNVLVDDIWHWGHIKFDYSFSY